METTHNPSELDGVRSALFGPIESEGQRLKVCGLATFILGLIAHGFGLLNLLLSHDSLHEFYWTVSSPWKFTLGRFMEPILRFFMGEIITLPWLTGLCGILFVALAVHLLSKIFALNSVWENILLSGICVTNITVTALIATYVHDFAGDTLALLLAVLAAWCWYQMQEGFSWKYTLLGAVSLTASFGFYQAYLAVLATAMCIFAILRLLRGDSAKSVVIHLLRIVPMLVLAVGAYFAAVRVTQRIFDVPATTGDVNDLTMIGSRLGQLWALTCDGYRQVWQELFTTFPWDSVKGVNKAWGGLVCLVNGVLAVHALWAMGRIIRKNKVRGVELFLILLLVALLPMAFSCVSIISTATHDLVQYAGYLYYLLILVVSREAGGGPWRQRLLMGLISLVLLSNVQVSNVAYEKKELEQQATFSAMTRVLSRLEGYEAYVPGESKVAIIGKVKDHLDPLETGMLEGVAGLYHISPITYPETVADYFEIVLQYPIDLCPPETQAAIQETEAFQSMPSYPAKGCIATINGIVVVKLS